MINLFKRPKAAGEATKYYWDKFTAPVTTHSVWDKYKVNVANTYIWDRWSLYATTGIQYIWNQYATQPSETKLYAMYNNAIFTPNSATYAFKHKFDRYTVTSGGDAYYSWSKSSPVYMWNKYAKVGSGEPSDPYIFENVTNYYSPQFLTAGYDASGSTISNYNVNSEEYTFFGEKMNTFAEDSNFDTIANWSVQVRFYKTATLNSSTGRIVYSNPFTYNGDTFVATLHWDRYKYDDDLTANITKFSDFDDVSTIHRCFFCSSDNNDQDTLTQYVFSNNLIDLETYKYMEIIPVYSGGESYDTYYLNPARISVTVNSQLKPSGDNWYDIICNYINCQVVKDSGNVALLWEVTNVAVQNIIANPNPSSGYHAGDFIETVSATTSDAYPSNGAQGDYWYIEAGSRKGAFIDTVTSTSGDTYPENDIQDGYWYSDKVYHAAGEDSRGTYIDSIYTTQYDLYPYDGKQGSYWYKFDSAWYTGSNSVRPLIQTDVMYCPDLDGMTYEDIGDNSTCEIHIGDTLYFYTGGFTVARNANNYVVVNSLDSWPQYDNECYFIKNSTSGYTFSITITANNFANLWNYTFPDGRTPLAGHPFLLNPVTIDHGPLANQIAGTTLCVPRKDYTFPLYSKTVNNTRVYESQKTPVTKNYVLDGHYLIGSISVYNCRSYTTTWSEYVPPAWPNYEYAGFWGLYTNTADDSSNHTWVAALQGDSLIKSDTLIGEVRSDSRTTYPDDGLKDSFWYVYQGTESGTTYRKNTYLGTVSSTSINTYPQDGIQGSYWYTYQTYNSTTSKGSFIEKVFSSLENDYPTDGIQYGYWYTLSESDVTTAMKGNYIETISSTVSSEYPADGEYNGYWYTAWPEDGYYPAWNDRNILSSVNYKQNINPSQDYIVGAVAAASIEFSSTLDFTDNMTNTKFKYFNNLGHKSDMNEIGIFNITSVERQSSGGYKIIGVDNISKFDKYCDDFIENTSFPLTLKQFFINLCNYCSAEYVANSLSVNDTYIVNDNFEGVNITGRQLLGYIAEAAGGYAYCDYLGRVCIGYYTSKGTVLSNTKYVSYFTNDYATPKIGKLVIQMTTDDVGTIATNAAGSQQYNITNNPLFYNDSASDNQEAADRILAKMVDVQYTPASLTLLEDYNINCGDIITVDGDTFYVMEKVMNNSGVSLNCFGNRERLTEGNTINSEIVALRGKSNELTRSIEETRSLITDNTNGLQTQLKQTADSFNLQVSQLNNVVSEIQADLSGISLSYSSTTGKASLRIGDVVVNNLVNDEYVNEAVAGIELTGYVRFNDLANSGSTTINGDNITTGTISADRINLTGSIQWGDLSNSTKNQIRNIASSGSVPDYIHSTYIDEVAIYSPTIYGARITAGTSSDGYVELSSTGMNFCSNRGGALIGMGYYAGNYNYPFITLGQGVDEWGTNRGMIKKFTNGLWIGDSDSISSSTVGSGTGIFINFSNNKIYKYIDGTPTEL